MRVYCAAPMRGVEQFNAPAIRATVKTLRDLGHEVYSPVEQDEKDFGLDFFEGTTGVHQEIIDKGFSLRKALETELRWIARNADAICVLPGWRLSAGCLAEVALARALDLPVAYLGGFDDFGAVTIEVDASDAFRGDHSWVPGLALPRVSLGFSEDERGISTSVTVARETWAAMRNNGILDMASESILEEADRLVSTDRQADYGHPLDNFSQTGRIWGALLNIGDISAELVGMMMAGVKMSRQTNAPKRDNLVDAVGYVKCVDMVIDERAAREALL